MALGYFIAFQSFIKNMCSEGTGRVKKASTYVLHLYSKLLNELVSSLVDIYTEV